MRWGFDLGGTKIEGVILDENNRVVLRKRIPTEADKGYQHVLSQVHSLLSMMVKETGLSPEKIGIGTPGSTDPATGLLKNCNAQALNKKPFHKDLQETTGLEITMVNDANCFALAETKMGAVPEVEGNPEVVFGVIMGSGVGGGIVIDGKLINGRKGNSGEWGHSFLDDSGGTCYCGNTGCVETILAGPHLEDYYESLTGLRKSLKDIAKLHEAGDEHARTTINRLIHFFGKGLANIVNILDPDVIVLGGGVSNLDILYTQGVEEVKKYVFNPTFDTPIVRPRLGDSAGVFGAAFL